MKKYLLWMICAAGAMLSACTSLQTITFDQLQAGDVSFPEQVRRVAVVNNMPAFTLPGVSKPIGYDFEGDGKTAAEVFANRLAEVQYFDEIIICDSTLRAADDTLRADRLLPKEEVQRLAEDLGVDMIFSFDRLPVRLSEGTAYLAEFSLTIKTVEAALAPVVRTYVPGRETPMLVVVKPDTIAWEITPELTDKQIQQEASEYAAGFLMEHLLPHWATVTRYYYDGGSVELRDAAVCLRENDWNGAFDLWTAAYEKGKGRKRMYAAFNLALYHEINDNVELAVEWLDKARQLAVSGSDDARIIMLYSIKLGARAEKMPYLRIQMQRFDENFQ